MPSNRLSRRLFLVCCGCTPTARICLFPLLSNGFRQLLERTTRTIHRTTIRKTTITRSKRTTRPPIMASKPERAGLVVAGQVAEDFSDAEAGNFRVLPFHRESCLLMTFLLYRQSTDCTEIRDQVDLVGYIILCAGRYDVWLVGSAYCNAKRLGTCLTWDEACKLFDDSY